MREPRAKTMGEEENVGDERQPWQVMEHLLDWDREMEVRLVLANLTKQDFDCRMMIERSAEEVETMLRRRLPEGHTKIPRFYGRAVPDTDSNREKARDCYELLILSQDLVEKFHNLYRYTDSYVKAAFDGLTYDYLGMRGHREYILDGEVYYFAMTPKGMELFRQFLCDQMGRKFGKDVREFEALVSNLQDVGEKVTPMYKEHHERLLNELTPILHHLQLETDNLRGLYVQQQARWRRLIEAVNWKVPVYGREFGESEHSMFQFRRIMAERRGRDWHNWV